MKNSIYKKIAGGLFGFTFSLFLILMSLSFDMMAQVEKAFTQRASISTPNKKIYNIKGDFTMIGNTNMTLQSYENTKNNSNNQMIYVDVDGDASTVNSSSATLGLSHENAADPSCSNILYAGLYWTGRANTGNRNVTATKTIPGSAVPLTSNQNVTSGQAITNTNYTMTVSRSGNGNSRRPIYTFTSSGSGNTYDFEIENSTYNVHYRVNNGSWVNTSNQSGSASGNLVTRTFTPVQIYSSGGTSIVVSSLKRDTQTNQSTSSYQGSSVATTVVTYTPAATNPVLDKWAVKIKGPAASSYETITTDANNIRFPNGSDDNMYVGYVEITDYVKNSAKGGLGSYTIADLALTEGDGGNVGYYGGWGMVVIYENSKMKRRDVTVFDGFAYVDGGNGGHTYELPVSGFQSVQEGDVKIKMGMMTGEGDVGITGDKFSIRNAANTAWVALAHGGNSTSNFFNSSVYIKSPDDPTVDVIRIPSLTNNTGVDFSMFDVPNGDKSIIANNQDNTKFQYLSTGDTYVIFNITFAVDAYVPDIQAINKVLNVNGSAPGTNVNPDDVIEYQVDVRNLGTEAIVDGKIVIPIPYTGSFVSAEGTRNFGSPSTTATPTFNNALGATGSIVWEVGTIPLPVSSSTILATLKYKLKVTNNCYVLSNPTCLPSIVVDGAITGAGAITHNSVGDAGHFITGLTTGSCVDQPINDPVTLYINRPECNSGDISKNFDFCTSDAIAVNSIRSEFPIGTRFYNEFPITANSIEYTNENPFPANTSATYYAIPAGNTGCNFEFTISITTNSAPPATPSGPGLGYCQNETAQALSATTTNNNFQLFWYADNDPTTQPVSSITPSTVTAGSFTYYVAQGTATCIGPRASIPVTVKPAPVVDAVSDQTVCKKIYTTAITFTGGGLGTVYNWVNSDPSIGIDVANGSGDIASFQTVNNTTSTISSTFTVTPTGSNGCIGVPVNFKIKVDYCPLPVTLASIAAKEVEDDVLVEWKTTEQVNFDRFELEKSLDIKSGFVYLATVKPLENSVAGNYSYLDRTPETGIPLYYRLKMIDRDNTYAYSSIVTSKVGELLTTKVFPNPSGEYISITSMKGIKEIQLINNSGKTVLVKSASGKNTTESFTLPSLSPGVYSVRIKTLDGAVQFKKVSINQ